MVKIFNIITRVVVLNRIEAFKTYSGFFIDLSDEEPSDMTSAVRKPLAQSRSRPPPPPQSSRGVVYMTVEDDEVEEDEEPADKRRNVLCKRKIIIYFKLQFLF